jgi:hypothetical protein
VSLLRGYDGGGKADTKNDAPGGLRWGRPPEIDMARSPRSHQRLRPVRRETSPHCLTALIVKREGAKKCAGRPRECEKIHRRLPRRPSMAPGAPTSVKKISVCDIYCQRIRPNDPVARNNKSRRSFHKSRTCFSFSRTCSNGAPRHFAVARFLRF